MNDTKKVVVRFPPSPTGFFHIGSARTALFNYLFAKQHNGSIRLRFEDTDKERSKEEYEKNILNGLAWLGIAMDGEVVHQSRRTEIYKKYVQRLIELGAAYVSKEQTTDSASASEEKRKEVIRLKNPNKKITFTDLIRGEITFDTSDLKDFVIAKSLEEPLYHLAVVVDDFEMGITHVIRGEDHISNTPRQILIQEALGIERPFYAHIPLILAPDRSKLSKRHGAVSVLEYEKNGYLPEALLNYLALLGWNPGNEQELFTKEELINEFRIEKVQKGGAMFNIEKLNWINKSYLQKKSTHELEKEIGERIKGTKLSKLNSGQKAIFSASLSERISYFGEVKSLIETGEFDYLLETDAYDTESLFWKKEGSAEDIKTHLREIIKILEKSGDQTANEVKDQILPYAEEKGKGTVLWPLRIALSGREKSIDPFSLIAILGKNESIERIKKALNLLK